MEPNFLGLGLTTVIIIEGGSDMNYDLPTMSSHQLQWESAT